MIFWKEDGKFDEGLWKQGKKGKITHTEYLDCKQKKRATTKSEREEEKRFSHIFAYYRFLSRQSNLSRLLCIGPPPPTTTPYTHTYTQQDRLCDRFHEESFVGRSCQSEQIKRQTVQIKVTRGQTVVLHYVPNKRIFVSCLTLNRGRIRQSIFRSTTDQHYNHVLKENFKRYNEYIKLFPCTHF